MKSALEIVEIYRTNQTLSLSLFLYLFYFILLDYRWNILFVIIDARSITNHILSHFCFVCAMHSNLLFTLTVVFESVCLLEYLHSVMTGIAHLDLVLPVLAHIQIVSCGCNAESRACKVERESLRYNPIQFNVRCTEHVSAFFLGL